MTHASLFSGIGGFDLAAEWVGWQNLFHCEWNPFGQQVLKHHFPNSISYHDITKTDFTIHRGQVDILTGGFPCQPYSSAGKRLGKEDERHLWPEMLRAIQEVQPRWVVGENVRGLTNWNGGLVFDEVQADLEAEGYEVTPFLLPACAVNAPHRRDRIWFVAYSNINGWKQEWRYDRSSQNVNGSDNAKFRSANTKDIDRCSTNGDIKKQSRINNETCIKAIYEKNQTTNSNGFCAMDKNIGQSKGNIRENKFKTNKGRALVQEGRCWFQLSDNRGLDRDKETLSSSKGNGLQNDISAINRLEGIVANTKNIRQEHALENGELERRRFGESNQRTAWDSFPSQSPICGGDDGLPKELDGITFSKWRQESIKAYGNAIVPQVAFQIFKAIQQYEAL